MPLLVLASPTGVRPGTNNVTPRWCHCPHGFTGRYASVRRFVGKLRAAAAPEARVVIITEPGEEGQVDYGEGPMVRDPESGKYRRTRLFVMTRFHRRDRLDFSATRRASSAVSFVVCGVLRLRGCRRRRCRP